MSLRKNVLTDTQIVTIEAASQIATSPIFEGFSDKHLLIGEL